MEQIRRKVEMIKTGCGLRFVLCRCHGCALEQEVVNNQQTLFNCFLKIPVSRYDIMYWLTRKNVQSTATHADRIAVFTARICWVFTWAQLMRAADGHCTATEYWSLPNYHRYSDTDPIFTMTRGTQCGHKSIISRTWYMFYSIQLSEQFQLVLVENIQIEVTFCLTGVFLWQSQLSHLHAI